jgi:Ni,Fe-hydrogenase I cytochrome b subunit
MDTPDIISLFTRWLHIASAVVGVGATVMMRFIILPVLERLPNGGEVLAQIRPGFKRLVHSAIGLLLLTGLYNYVVVAIPKVRVGREQGIETLARYHSVMGVKILLALALFIIAILLLKPVPALEANRKTWLSVNVVLGLLILLLAAYLRRLWPM